MATAQKLASSKDFFGNLLCAARNLRTARRFAALKKHCRGDVPDVE